MLTFGITGGIGSGKSVVSKLMDILGVPVYISDIESKKLLNQSEEVRESLIKAFGDRIYHGTQIDRALFASIIFNDRHKLAEANSIIHPYVKKHFFEWLSKHQSDGKDLVATESAILFESGFNGHVDKVILVYAPLECRIARVVSRDNATREETLARMQNQMADEEKLELSDYVILNDDSISVIEQLRLILQKSGLEQLI